MADLDSKIQGRLRELCQKITVAHDLDTEIQEELYGHMEDKLRAYLSGEERLSDDDAYVLVREHFGDAKTLKALLRDAHPHEARMSLARRLLLAFIVFAAVDSVESVVYGVFRASSTWAALRYGQIWDAVLQAPAVIYSAISCVAIAVQFLILCRWQRRIELGRPVRLMRVGTTSLVAIAVTLFACHTFVPTVLVFNPLPGEQWTSTNETSLLHWIRVVWHILPLAPCIVWLWWCDRTPRAAWAGAWALCAWFARGALLTTTSLLAHPMFNLTAAEPAPCVPPEHVIGGSFFGPLVNWSFSFETREITGIVPSAERILQHQLALGLAACALYMVAQRLSIARNIRSTHTTCL